jgi:hypothetical protein
MHCQFVANAWETFKSWSKYGVDAWSTPMRSINYQANALSNANALSALSNAKTLSNANALSAILKCE